ncbi:MAG: GNAT family N-acetyltransferase [Chloroflexi bacterium]|nr:GNAT family N-acetyltransferase [Chloroflexota bacterium]
MQPQEVHALLGNGGFPRPFDDPERTQRMLDNASFYITVRDRDTLVGFTRVLTDYAYYGIVVEVAVAPSHKGRGVGQELLRQAREYATPQVTLILASSEEGESFYEHLGWQKMDRGFRLRREA